MENDIVVKEQLSIPEMRSQINLIQHLMKEIMIQDQHYGIIQGCGKKPTLLKAGAEKLCFTFRLAPTFDIVQKDFDDKHREYQVKCTLTHIDTGKLIAQGVGSASTMESKFRYRNNWVGGEKVKTENPDIADVYNTVLKMAKKRAFVDTTITATAASDIFTQDIEDMEIAVKKDKEELKKKNDTRTKGQMQETIVRAMTIGIISNEKVSEVIFDLGGNDSNFMELDIEIAVKVYNKIIDMANSKNKGDNV